jgi:DNA-binding winged helix-turn-helix (wHTH) protein
VQNGTIYEFSGFQLIPDDGLLLHDGTSVPLTPKAFSTLVLLVEHHGHLVKKSELIEKVWLNASVDEAAVSRCVWTIRHALGEDSKSQHFIQTVPTLGYKFVAQVSTIEPQRSDDAHVLPARANRSRLFAASAAIALVAVALIAGYFFFFRRPTIADATENRVAVLPFKVLGDGDPRYELGIADAVILKLSAANGIGVRSLQAVQGYAEKDLDPVASGREQEVDWVVASNYQSPMERSALRHSCSRLQVDKSRIRSSSTKP